MFVSLKPLILYTFILFQFANYIFGNQWKSFVLKKWKPFICIGVQISSEKHLLVSRFFMSVRSSARLSVCMYQLFSNKWIFAESEIGVFTKVCWEASDLVKIGEKIYFTLHEDIYVDSSKKGNPFLRLYDKAYQLCTICSYVSTTIKRKSFLLFHYKKCFLELTTVLRFMYFAHLVYSKKKFCLCLVVPDAAGSGNLMYPFLITYLPVPVAARSKA
jgi:hypothetical protein